MKVRDEALELIWYFYHRLEHTFNEEYSKKDWEISKMCAVKVAEELIKVTASAHYYKLKQEILNL